MQSSRLVRAWFVLLCGLAPQALAQCEPDWASANPSPDLIGTSRCSTQWDPDGAGPAATQLVVGGSNLIGGVQPDAGKVATFDGTRWTVLGVGPGTTGAVSALTVWNGLLIAGGDFTGGGMNRIAVWTGSAWQPLGAGFPAAVTALAVWNGSLVAAGYFTTGNTPALQTWNGSAWTILPNPPLLNIPQALISYQGLLCVGGTKTSPLFGVIERWNGSTWATSITAGPTTTNGAAVRCFAVRPSLLVGGADTLYAGGVFSGIGSSTANSLASTTGGSTFTWSSVGSNTSTDCNAVHSRNGALTGFSVTASFALPTQAVRQFSSSTGAWTSLGSANATSLSYYAGSYHRTSLNAAAPCSRWNGTAWIPVLGEGLQGEVRALTHSGNDIIVGGAIQATAGVALNAIAVWNGTTFEPLGAGVIGTSVDALLTRANGDVIAGGSFTSAGGTTVNNIARWNGSTWSAFGTGTNQPVLALCAMPNGDLIAGGAFTMAGGVSCNRVARWNGTAWSTLNFGFNGDVLALAVRSDGALFAAGTFTAASASSCSRIARWDGFVWQPLGTGLNGPVHGIGFLSNGDLVAVGAFTSAGGVTADRCARWNGTTWFPMGSASGDPTPAQSVFVLPDGEVLAGRGFHQPGITPDAGIARWNGSTWSGVDSGLAARTLLTPVKVRAIAQRADGVLFVGGDFGFADGLVARGLAELRPTCPASASNYGTGCSSGAGLLTLTADTLPWIGSTFRTTTTGVAAGSLCVALIGLTQLSIPLPALVPEGQPGCSLLSSLDILLFAPNGPGNTATASFALANDASLIGVPFFQQTIPFEFDAGGAIAAVRGSNALSLVIGTL